jgi:fructokinase
MKKILSIGEYLMDMLPDIRGKALNDVQSFIKMPGGAPMNVAVAIKRLGGNVSVMTQVGSDPFGLFLREILKKENIDTTYVYETKEYKTSLAFVSLDEHGERDFVFYRDPSADQMLTINKDIISSIGYDMLHFGSVGLADYPLKVSTDLLIDHALDNNKIISFDVNVRHMLFKDRDIYKRLILDYIQKAHVIKVSEEELIFLTGILNFDLAIQSLWSKHHKLMLVSKGSEGVSAYTKEDVYHQKAYKVEVVDTTGAGDALMGGFLYALSLENDPFNHFNDWLPKALEMASYCGALAITKKGAMASLPYLSEVIKK